MTSFPPQNSQVTRILERRRKGEAVPFSSTSGEKGRKGEKAHGVIRPLATFLSCCFFCSALYCCSFCCCDCISQLLFSAAARSALLRAALSATATAFQLLSQLLLSFSCSLLCLGSRCNESAEVAGRAVLR